ncbi:MAG: glycosyltransferase family 2 protein [Bacteroidota bacterium]
MVKQNISNSHVKLSIGIVTRNRPSSLAATLKSLYSQYVNFYEVIVSDDSSEESAIHENRKIADFYNCKYIKGPQKGLYANRNFVALACKGTHIRSMDDDHIFPEGHIKACLDAIDLEPETIWTIGEYSPKHNVPRIKPYPKPGQLHPKGYAFIPEKSGDEYYGISCGASIYPAIVFQNKILNVEYYKFGTVFLEYGARLKYLGYTIKVLDTTYIFHDDIQTSAVLVTNSVLIEARIHSVLCMCLIYKPTLGNKFLAIYQIIKDLIIGGLTLKALVSAFKNYKITKSTLN